MILSASYRGNEFFRVGYYVYNRYNATELMDNPLQDIQIDRVVRGILSDKPRITRIEIPWNDKETQSLSTNEVDSYEAEKSRSVDELPQQQPQKLKHTEPLL
jgi:histone chaperone ASF1